MIHTDTINPHKINNSHQRVDDTLLQSLLIIAKLHHDPHSSESLIAGLPLVNNKLTPDLFVRAANRAGFSSQLVYRPLNQLSNLVLPCVILLKNDNACVLKAINNQSFSIVLPESGGGEKNISLNQLEAEYTGQAFFIQKLPSFDDSTINRHASTTSHWLWDVLANSWPIYTEVLVASLMINIFALASPLFIMNVYDRVVPNHAFETLWVLAIGIGIVLMFDFMMKTLRSYFIDIAGKKSDLMLSSSIFERVIGLKMKDRPNSVGAFANNFHEFEMIRDFLTSATLTTLIDLPFLFLFILIIFILGGNLAFIPLCMLPLAILIGLVIQRPLKKTITQLYNSSAQKNATLIEALSNLSLIKTTGAEGQFQRQWEQNVGQIALLSLKSRFFSSIAVYLTTFFQQIASISVVAFGVYKIAEGELTTGGLIACTILTGRALAPISQVASLLTRYQQAKNSLHSMERLMALPTERESGKKYLHRPSINGAITFKNISFSYPNQPIEALSDISFSIRSGERVGIIGRIGSGKSTLEKLMLGLYEAEKGSILIDGTDIRQIDPADLRRQIGYIPQDISLINASVKDNIVMGAKYVDDACILKAAEIAGVSDFVNNHPSGFDMPVGENGLSLSGGQRQSVAIARALLLSPSVYIMDEPSNAMDNGSEETFKQRLVKHLTNQTLILVTHKASLLSLVDRLIVLDGSKLIADGSKSQVLDALKKGQITVPK